MLELANTHVLSELRLTFTFLCVVHYSNHLKPPPQGVYFGLILSNFHDFHVPFCERGEKRLAGASDVDLPRGLAFGSDVLESVFSLDSEIAAAVSHTGHTLVNFGTFINRKSFYFSPISL